MRALLDGNANPTSAPRSRPCLRARGAGLGVGVVTAVDRDSQGDVAVQVTQPREPGSVAPTEVVPTESGGPVPARPGWDVVRLEG